MIDSRGVYDSVHNKESFGIGLSDARTGLEVLHVKANLGKEKGQHLLWAPSDLNLSDGLTKDSAEARKPRWSSSASCSRAASRMCRKFSA